MKVCPECQRYYAPQFAFCPRDGRELTAMGGAQDDDGDPLLGTLVRQRYRLESRLSRSERASVYAATVEGSDRLRVVKLLRSRRARDEELVERYLKGARAAARLKHPAIVTPLEHGRTDGGRIFLVLEVVGGLPLVEALACQERRSIAWLVGIARQICQALEEAHRKGVAPWDLSFDKVMVRRWPGGIPRVTLLDLGLRHQLEPRRGADRPSSGSLTLPYEAPAGQVASWVPRDVLGFGELLFEVLTGQRPRGEDRDAERLEQGLARWSPEGDTEAAGLIEGECQGDGMGEGDRGVGPAGERLASLVLRCLAPSPAARPRSMGEIDRELERVAREPGAGEATPESTTDPDTSEGIPMEPIDTIQRVRRFQPDGAQGSPGGLTGSRRRLTLALIGAALFLTGLGLGLLWRA